MDRIIEFALNHYILSLALIIVTYLLIQDFFDTALKKYKAVSPLLAVSKMNDDSTVIIDVRESAEFAGGHIENAVNMPLSKLTEELPKLAQHKKTPVLVACQTGTRASSAGNALAKAGFEHVFVITGGMQAWVEDYKLPIKKSGKKQKVNP